MRVVKRDYKKGIVKLIVQSLDDLWYLSRIVSKGDLVSSVTYRKISISEKEGERRRVFLKLRVEKVDFSDFGNSLKLLGVIVESGDERVPTGEHHSFTVEVNDELVIEKIWTSVEKNYLKRSESKKDPNLMIVSCDYGDASFAFYHDYGIEYAGVLSEELGGKKEVKAFEKNKEAFIKILLNSVNDFAVNKNVKKVLIGGAGSIIDSLKKNIDSFPYIKNRTFFSRISYAGSNGIKELVRKGEVDKLVSDNFYSEHVKLVNKLLEQVGRDGKAVYGYKQVKSAVEAGAVSDLIITDNFLSKEKEAGRYEALDKLIQSCEENNATINIIPSNTEHGENVDNLTGIASLLRYTIRQDL